MSRLSTATWRYLGLGVAASYAGLGVFQAIQPVKAALGFYDIPKHVISPQVDARQQVGWLMTLIAARDISTAVILFTFAYKGKTREMGTVILGSLIVCAADSVTAWTRRGPATGLGLLVGAGIWGVIGYGLAF
ncbi:hypothetical protein PFICI_15125 [Pestalotiopsis fici W106-1]|uniref:Uncharacterized protein n=1 Tax=Pestalotiopsis fici (strain W106-1 / CGMCC3.15140) TaxID=1229662 RepID=W3WGY3_PESFW|nr:uncharacterized protein PFICI_15125 [Pestalotiopsis fici W106-1]ETS73180.1 hypothetical protein PFICI_15125 [Pestalotiopsis fici W106-1]